MPNKTKLERVRDLFKSGEIVSLDSAAMLSSPIAHDELLVCVSELERDGYTIDTVERGLDTGYYMPDHVDHGALAAWVAKPMIGGAA